MNLPVDGASECVVPRVLQILLFRKLPSLAPPIFVFYGDRLQGGSYSVIEGIGVADYSVFVDETQWPEAVRFYKTFATDGPRKVVLPTKSFGGDLLSLLDQIQTVGNPYILIVTHADPNGMAMRLVKRPKKKSAAGGTNNSSLCLLMEIARIQTGLDLIGKTPKEKQRVEDWDELLKRIMRPEDRKKQPLQALLAEGEPQAFQDDVRHRKEQRAKLKQAKEKILSAPGDHKRELETLEKNSTQYEAAERDEAEKAVTQWLEGQRKALNLEDNELNDLLNSMKAVQGVKLKDVQIRGCRLGQKEDTMLVVLRFLGAEHLVAPEVRTIYGALNPSIGSQFVQYHKGPKSPGICGKDDLAKPSNCWWSFDDGKFRMTVKHVQGITYYFDSAADSSQTVEDWVKARLGNPRTRLGSNFPIHMLFTAPPVFPLESEFADQMNEVSQSD